MRAAYTVAVLAFVAFFVLGGGEYVRDRWRARSDHSIDHHPMAVALRTLADDERRRTEHERTVAAAIAERLRSRQVIAECEFFDIEAATAGEHGRCVDRG